MRANREDLADVLFGKVNVNHSKLLEVEAIDRLRKSKDEMVLLWTEEPSNWNRLPSLIIIEKDKQKDFIAWGLTYLGDFRPISAYCRIIDLETAKTLFQNVTSKAINSFSNECLGLVLAETVTYILDSTNISSFSPIAIMQTYSYIMARALFQGIPCESLDELGNDWFSVRLMANQPELKLGVKDLQVPWRVLLALMDKNISIPRSNLFAPVQIVKQACGEIKTSGIIGTETWRNLVCDNSKLMSIYEDFEGTREELVLFFERLIRLLLNDKTIDPMIVSFLSGYCASLIARGDFKHYHLFEQYIDEMPTAIMWYGLCAGLQRPSNVLGALNGLGYRALRDIKYIENLMGHPRCDINFKELSILCGGEKLFLDFLTNRTGSLEVELTPGITTMIKWRQSQFTQDDIQSDSIDLGEVKYLMRELSNTLNRVDGAYNKLWMLFDQKQEQRKKRNRGSNKSQNKKRR